MEKSLKDFATQGLERPELDPFFNNDMEFGGKPLTISDTELGVLEYLIQNADRGKNALLTNPVDSNCFPRRFCSIYSYTRSGAFPSAPPRGGVLLFPQRSYLSGMDELHFTRSLSQGDSLIERNPVGCLDDISDEPSIYSAKSNFRVDLEEELQADVVFVDLRRPQWRQNISTFINLSQRHPDVSFLFYVDNREDVDQSILESIEATLSISPSDLSDTSLESPSEVTTEFGQYEVILSEDELEFELHAVKDERLRRDLFDIWEAKSELESEGVLTNTVRRLYNLISKLCFAPERWNRQVTQNGYFDTTDKLLQTVKYAADGDDSATGDYLKHIHRNSKSVISQLNKENKLTTTIYDIVEDCRGDGESVTIVVKNRAWRDALLQLFASREENLRNLTVTTRSDLEPKKNEVFVFGYPPYLNDSLYEFPPSSKVVVVSYSFWTSIIRDYLEDTELTKSVSTVDVGNSTSHGQAGVDEDALKRTHRRSQDTQTTRAVQENTKQDDHEKRLEFQLSNDETVEAGWYGRLPVYDSQTATVDQTLAGRVSEGDDVLFVNSGVDDVYESLLEAEHERTIVQEHDTIVEVWRDVLWTGINQNETDDEFQSCLTDIQAEGSEITSDGTVQDWATGNTIGPDDPKDVERVLRLYNEDQVEMADTVYESMEFIRQLHRLIGKKVKRCVETEYSMHSSIEVEGIDESSLMKNIRDNTEIVTVLQIDEV